MQYILSKKLIILGLSGSTSFFLFFMAQYCSCTVIVKVTGYWEYHRTVSWPFYWFVSVKHSEISLKLYVCVFLFACDGLVFVIGSYLDEQFSVVLHSMSAFCGLISIYQVTLCYVYNAEIYNISETFGKRFPTSYLLC